MSYLSEEVQNKWQPVLDHGDLPKIGFKTRYGMVANPFAEGLTDGLGRLVQDSNVYYRRLIVANLM